MSTVSVTNDTATLIVTSKKHGEFRVRIDKEDAGRVAAHTWAVQKQPHAVYFVTHIPQKPGRQWPLIGLPKFIMGAPAGYTDSNTLDSRKSNLRLLPETVKPVTVTTSVHKKPIDNRAYAARLYEAAARMYEAAARAYEAE
jgi:hypothetical protein